ncbi:MAG: hypothetical protein M1819_001947 [Sarea resinae]|nr:MAG: hypothetical protein M1819_001947 [Sarea resinae]
MDDSSAALALELLLEDAEEMLHTKKRKRDEDNTDYKLAVQLHTEDLRKYQRTATPYESLNPRKTWPGVTDTWHFRSAVKKMLVPAATPPSQFRILHALDLRKLQSSSLKLHPPHQLHRTAKLIKLLHFHILAHHRLEQFLPEIPRRTTLRSQRQRMGHAARSSTSVRNVSLARSVNRSTKSISVLVATITVANAYAIFSRMQ